MVQVSCLKTYLQLECVLYSFTPPLTPHEGSDVTLKSFDSLLSIYLLFLNWRFSIPTPALLS